MGKYIGSRLKLVRKLGLLPGFTSKIIKLRTKTPGEHGKLTFTKIKRSSLADDYKQRLIEKQKLRFNYCLTEKQLLKYYKKAKSKYGSTGLLLLQLIESRLDCILFRLGFTKTILEARQIINHGHILVNNKKVTIGSFLCKINDIISIKQNSFFKNIISLKKANQNNVSLVISKTEKFFSFKDTIVSSYLPSHLYLDFNKFEGKILSLVKRQEILIKINELKVIEYYSR
jgi:small subunit ribosomal protein S4